MNQRKSRHIRIGTSGYQYDHWQGVLYPESLPHSEWLEHYAQSFDCVEINNSFYQLPDASTVKQWREKAPAGFKFAMKYSRFGTHMKKLKDPESHLEPFTKRVRLLGNKLGPILVQLPPHWRPDPSRLDAFLEHADKRSRCAIEFRDPQWLCDEVYEILRRHDAALCIHDLIEDHPRVMTSSWGYLRFHGPGKNDGYPYQRLSAWSDWIGQQRKEGTALYVFFNNDAEGHAVKDARRLSRYLDKRGSQK